MVVPRIILIALLFCGTEAHSVEMGTCRMVCDHSPAATPQLGSSVGRAGKRGPPGMKGEKGAAGSRGVKGEPGNSCLCQEQNALQQQIDEMREQLRQIHSPRDCSEVVERKEGDKGGVFTIYPYADETGVDVYCDTTTKGGGWIVFQRRMDGSKDFYRGWSEYEDGFGDLYGEFWLGLKNIYRLMGTGKFELRVDLGDFDNNTAFAEYSIFEIGGPESHFAINTSGYSGTAGNALQLQNVAFSTNDRDNDQDTSNCAANYKGAMWYTSCHSANLNGLYLKGKTKEYAKGVVWSTFKSYYYSLKFSEMKMRRKK